MAISVHRRVQIFFFLSVLALIIAPGALSAGDGFPDVEIRVEVPAERMEVGGEYDFQVAFRTNGAYNAPSFVGSGKVEIGDTYIQQGFSNLRGPTWMITHLDYHPTRAGTFVISPGDQTASGFWWCGEVDDYGEKVFCSPRMDYYGNESYTFTVYPQNPGPNALYLPVMLGG